MCSTIIQFLNIKISIISILMSLTKYIQDKKKDDKKDEIQLEDLIERERAALNSVKFTRVTLESFLAWKKRKVREKKDAIIKDEEKKRTDYKAGRQIGVCNLFLIFYN